MEGAVQEQRLRPECGFGAELQDVAEDATTSTMAAEAMRKRGDEFYTLFRSAPLYLAVSRLEDGALLELNDLACQAYGATREELLGRSALEIAWYSAEDRARILAALAATGRVHNLEIALHDKAGKRVPCLYSGEVVAAGGEQLLLSLATDITERQQAEAALRERQAFEAQIIASVQQGIIVHDLEGRFRVWNTFMEGLTGFTEAEVLGRHPGEVFPFLEAAGVLAGLGRAAAGEILKLPPFPWRAAATGRGGWARCKLSPLRGASGEILGVIQTVLDVTERKGIEDALLASQEKLQLLLNSTGEAIAAMDLEGNCTFCNPAALRLLGYHQPEQVLGKNLHALCHHSRADGRPYPVEDCWIRRTLAKRQGSHLAEDCFWHQDGTPLPVEVWSYPQFRHGELVGVTVTFVDITERKAASERLRLSERRYQVVAAAVNDGLWEWNLVTGVRYRSKQWLQLLGYGEGELGSDSEEFFELVHPEDRDLVVLSNARHIVNGERFEEEFRLRHKDGHYLWVLSRGQVVRDAEGHSIRMVGAITDITGRKEAELTRIAAQERLEALVQERTKQVRHLAAVATLAEDRERRAIAHDLHDGLGQLLHVARLKLDTLAKGTSPTAPAGDRVAELRGLLNEGSKLVRSLTSQLSPPVLETLGLVPALSWLAEDLEQTYGLVVTVQGPCEPLSLSPVQGTVLFRAVRELLINVAKHAGVKAADLRLDAREGWLVLEVQDRGPGVADLQALVQGGKGFGLKAIQKRILDFGGDISFQSQPGEGTTVALRIPCGPVAPAARP
jgi:PAS domain S-box-containing protein